MSSVDCDSKQENTSDSSIPETLLTKTPRKRKRSYSEDNDSIPFNDPKRPKLNNHNTNNKTIIIDCSFRFTWRHNTLYKISNGQFLMLKNICWAYLKS